MTDVREIAPGLHRWTAWHEHWQEHVASLAVETDDGLVLIDPLDPPRQFGAAAHVLITVFWHARSTPEIGEARVWSPAANARTLANRGVTITDPIDDENELPGGLEAIPTARRGEVVYWLPEQRSIAVGDVLLGAGAKPRATTDPLRLCPQRWLGKASHAELRASLRPILGRPVERVLPAHGEPVLRDGRSRLEALLA